MIKLSDWDRLYRHTFDWVLRRLEPDCLKMYKDTEEEWLEALRAFNKIQEELFEKYSVKYKSGTKFKKGCIKCLELTADELFELFHKHLNQYTNHTIRYFIFNWWNSLRYYVENAQPELDQPWLYFKPATEEEIEQAKKDFSHIEEDFYGKKRTHNHTFDNRQVLEYRGNRFIVDNEWQDAWTKDKNGNIRSFQLQWDWWFPIDEYLDLYNV